MIPRQRYWMGWCRDWFRAPPSTSRAWCWGGGSATGIFAFSNGQERWQRRGRPNRSPHWCRIPGSWSLTGTSVETCSSWWRRPEADRERRFEYAAHQAHGGGEMSGDGLGRRNDRSRLRSAWRMLALIVGTAACAGPDHRDIPILLEQGITIGDTAGPGALPAPPWLLRHSLGYVVTVPDAEMGPLLFDSAGRFIRPIGDLGDGPGEYRRPHGITPLAGDSIIIFDKRIRRGTVMDESLRVARTFPVSTGPWRVIELPDGTLLASSGTYSLQVPFQHLTRDGGVLGPV